MTINAFMIFQSVVLEIRHFLNIIACANQVLVKKNNKKQPPPQKKNKNPTKQKRTLIYEL